jgi:hypothetical protein
MSMASPVCDLYFWAQLWMEVPMISSWGSVSLLQPVTDLGKHLTYVTGRETNQPSQEQRKWHLFETNYNQSIEHLVNMPCVSKMVAMHVILKATRRLEIIVTG